jgi:purine-cytosine permease-like protein
MVKRAISFIDRGHVGAGSLFIAISWISVFGSTAVADEAQPLIKRLDDATRAKVLAALAGLIILGFAMVLLTWLGARITERYRRSSPVLKPTPRPSEHEWARKPLSEDDS